MSQREYREYRRLYFELVAQLVGQFPHIRRVYSIIPWASRLFCRTQLSCLWDVLDEFVG